MVRFREVSVVKTIVFIFLGAALLLSIHQGNEVLSSTIVAGILGYIAKDIPEIQENFEEEKV